MTIWFEVAMTTLMSSLCFTMTHPFLIYVFFLSFDACWKNQLLSDSETRIFSLSEYIYFISSYFIFV